MTTTFRGPLAALLLAGLASAHAHMTLPPGTAPAGSEYRAVFRLGHPCADAEATTGVRVRLPEGFTLQGVETRPGWRLEASGLTVSWTAERPEAYVKGHTAAQFVLSGRLPDTPQTLWFGVLQTCDVGQADWATPPTPQQPKPDFPAARLEVVPAGTR